MSCFFINSLSGGSFAQEIFFVSFSPSLNLFHLMEAKFVSLTTSGYDSFMFNIPGELKFYILSSILKLHVVHVTWGIPKLESMTMHGKALVCFQTDIR